MPFCDQCQYEAPTNYVLKVHHKYLHVKYDCIICGHKSSSKNILVQHKRAAHEELEYPFKHCTFTAASKGTLSKHIKKKCMKESNTNVVFATINSLQSPILLNTRNQSMKE